MTFPGIPGLNQQILTPPIKKTVHTCCGVVCLAGTPRDWTCPACGTTHRVGE